jgi:outer membrane protein TolC
MPWQSSNRFLQMLQAGLAILLGGWGVSPVRAQEACQRHVLTRSGAIAWALQNSPELAVVRQNRGIAAAGVVIARTYPFNPFWQSYVLPDAGPRSAGITNPVLVQDTFRLDLELRGQGKFRRQAASAALSRTEWEIAFQEMTMVVRVGRAFNTYLYRQGKLRLVEETLRLQEETEKQVRRLMDLGKMNAADVLLAHADVVEGRALEGPARVALVMARQDLRRALGAIHEDFDVTGRLEPPATPAADYAALAEQALGNRADLRALRLMVAEAEARIRLEIANRIPNPSIGPAYERNETSVNFMGSWLIWQLPVFNLRQGDIQQRQAERDRVVMDVRRLEVQVQQDVQTALARMKDARDWVSAFHEQTLPVLTKTLQGLEKLFEQGQPGADLVRLIDTRRRLIRARDGYLDALWELSQAQADLAFALGDPSLFLMADESCPTSSPAPRILPPVLAPPPES